MKHTIFYDYEGCYKFLDGWTARTPASEVYASFMKKFMSDDLKVDWVKVQSHSANTFNDVADNYAKLALTQSKVERVQENINIPYKSFYMSIRG